MSAFFAEIFTAENLVSLLTLTALEIVLGIDNIIFISILTSKLPPAQRARGRSIGLALALITRIGLLFSITWVMGLRDPLVAVFGRSFSGRDLILLGGGLFLLAKATYEIHERLEVEPEPEHKTRGGGRRAFFLILIQIMLLDIVFSLDSVITAVGMVQSIAIMVTAMVAAVGVMLVFAGSISRFVERHPTIKILALSFLILIGVMLIVEGMGQHVNKGYIYFAMAFALGVELINMRVRKKQERPLELHNRFKDEVPEQGG